MFSLHGQHANYGCHGHMQLYLFSLTLLSEQTIPHHVLKKFYKNILYQLTLTIMYLDNARGGPQHIKI